MLPDTLPVLGDGCGGVLALRIGADSHIDEVIAWDHELCQWIPYGATLAEAILCDIARPAAGEDPESEEWYEDWRGVERPVELWAVDCVRRSTTPNLEWPDPIEVGRSTVRELLLANGLCELASRDERAQRYLRSGLTSAYFEVGAERIAERLGVDVDWDTVLEWAFDTSLIPQQYHADLAQLIGRTVDDVLAQDWDSAASEAQKVCQLRPDLGWPHALLGWAAERRADRASAIQHYLSGLEALGTSCSFMERSGDKFVVKRLRDLVDHLSNEEQAHPYLQAALKPETQETFPSRVRQFWLRQAEEAEKRNDHALAYRCFYNAGWDHFVSNDMDGVLDGLVRSSEAAGYVGLHRVAQHHRACLEAQT